MAPEPEPGADASRLTRHVLLTLAFAAGALIVVGVLVGLTFDSVTGGALAGAVAALLVAIARAFDAYARDLTP